MMFAYYPSVWQSRILPDKHMLAKYWDQMGHTAPVRDHRVKSIPDWKDKVIPLLLHADGVPITGIGKSWQKSKSYYSWQSLLGVGSSMELMFHIFGLWEISISKSREGNTRAYLWKVLSWSFNALEEGTWPTKDWENNDWPAGSWEAGMCTQKWLADGFRGIIMYLVGDLEQHWKVGLWSPNLK
eukprot:5139112-Karenia_brevis.AAC.1